MKNNIVVIGAGVSGLTSALLLSRIQSNLVTIIAKHMPGDYDIEYASPWAGANFLPTNMNKDSEWERRTWPHIQRLATQVPEAGIHLQKAQIYRRNKDRISDLSFDSLFMRDPWYRHYMPDYRELLSTELPTGVDSGCEFGSACINTAIYLPWLVSQCLRNGVVIRRIALNHIREAKAHHHSGAPADIIVNASGLLASRLGGLEDDTVYPIRGQIVLVRNEVSLMTTISGTEDADDEVCYAMQRAAGGGTILGGTYEKGSWESSPDPNTALRIMKRCIKLNPEMIKGQGIEALQIVRHGVGLRPGRSNGVRIETDRNLFEDSTPVVHNYGHAGWGYQGSFGCAERVLELVQEIQQDPKSKI